MFSEWKTEQKEVQVCGCVNGEIGVNIPYEVDSKLNAIAKAIKNQEFIAYLIGIVDDNYFWIQDIFIPEQEATSSTAFPLESPPKDCIGIFHSHHTMGTFFSFTDQDNANLNHDLSIVGAYRPKGNFSYKATVRKKVDCGAMLRLEAKVEVERRIEIDKEFAKVTKTKIRNKTYDLFKPVKDQRSLFHKNDLDTQVANEANKILDDENEISSKRIT